MNEESQNIILFNKLYTQQVEINKRLKVLFEKIDKHEKRSDDAAEFLQQLRFLIIRERLTAQSQKLVAEMKALAERIVDEEEGRSNG